MKIQPTTILILAVIVVGIILLMPKKSSSTTTTAAPAGTGPLNDAQKLWNSTPAGSTATSSGNFDAWLAAKLASNKNL